MAEQNVIASMLDDLSKQHQTLQSSNKPPKRRTQSFRGLVLFEAFVQVNQPTVAYNRLYT